MNAVRPELILFKKRLIRIVFAGQFRVAANSHGVESRWSRLFLNASQTARITALSASFGEFE